MDILPAQIALLEQEWENYSKHLRSTKSIYTTQQENLTKEHAKRIQYLRTCYQSLVDISLIEAPSLQPVDRTHFTAINKSLGRSVLLVAVRQQWYMGYDPELRKSIYKSTIDIQIPNRASMSPVFAPLSFAAKQVSNLNEYNLHKEADFNDVPLATAINRTTRHFRFHNLDIYEAWKQQLRTNPEIRKALHLDNHDNDSST